MNKERRQVQLWALSLQQRIPVQDAEGVLVLVDRVGVRHGAVFALSREAGPVAVFVLHHQVCIALGHDAAARQVLCAQNVNVRNQPKLKERINYISTESDFARLYFVISLLKRLPELKQPSSRWCIVLSVMLTIFCGRLCLQEQLLRRSPAHLTIF